MSTVRFKEVRTLIVPLEAAVDAILELDRSHGGRLAHAKVMEARVEPGARPYLLLIVRHATAGAPRIEHKQYFLPVVAAALIHYCSRREVPLPRRAEKTIEIVPEGFEFRLTSLTELETLHGDVKCTGLAAVAEHRAAMNFESELSEAAAARR